MSDMHRRPGPRVIYPRALAAAILIVRPDPSARIVDIMAAAATILKREVAHVR